MSFLKPVRSSAQLDSLFSCKGKETKIREYDINNKLFLFWMAVFYFMFRRLKNKVRSRNGWLSPVLLLSSISGQ
jgi:hypothetical protein